MTIGISRKLRLLVQTGAVLLIAVSAAACAKSHAVVPAGASASGIATSNVPNALSAHPTVAQIPTDGAVVQSFFGKAAVVAGSNGGLYLLNTDVPHAIGRTYIDTSGAKHEASVGNTIDGFTVTVANARVGTSRKVTTSWGPAGGIVLLAPAKALPDRFSCRPYSPVAGMCRIENLSFDPTTKLTGDVLSAGTASGGAGIGVQGYAELPVGVPLKQLVVAFVSSGRTYTLPAT